MPARKKFITHDARTRQKIQTTQLVKRLASHVLGDVELSSTQVRAAEILLNKTLPSLSQMTLEGGENPIQYAQVSGEPLSTQQWMDQQSHGDHSPDHNTH